MKVFEADSCRRKKAKRFLLGLLLPLLLVPALAGCVSKSVAKAQAQEAYMAGQRQAMMQALQAQGKNVQMVGPFKKPIIPWEDGLTLAKAFVEAGYVGVTDPSKIIIVRKGVGTEVSPNKLLKGEDVPLEAGDIVNVR